MTETHIKITDSKSSNDIQAGDIPEGQYFMATIARNFKGLFVKSWEPENGWRIVGLSNPMTQVWTSKYSMPLIENYQPVKFVTFEVTLG